MTEMSRRAVLGASAAGAASLAAGLPAAPASAAGVRDLYTRRRFTRLRGLQDNYRTLWQRTPWNQR